jgi:hypothetical protein
VEHRPSPHHGGVPLQEETDRHHLDPGGSLRRDDLALTVHVGLAVDAEHARDRVAVDVAVESARLLAVGGKSCCQVRRHRRLAHAALARGDADHVLDLGERALGQAPTAQRLLESGLLVVGEHVEPDPHLGHALECGHVLRHRLLEVGANRAAGRGQRDDDVHLAGLVDVDRAHHPEVDDRPPQLGVDHGPEGLGDLFLRGHAPILAKRGSRSRKEIDRPLGPVDRGGEVAVLPARYVVRTDSSGSATSPRRPGLSG